MSYILNPLFPSEKNVAQYEKKLSICLSSNGFSFSLTDVFDRLLSFGQVQCDLNVAMPQLITDIKGSLAQAHIQTYGLNSAELVAPSRLFVWVPQHLYDDARQRDYLDSVGKVNATSSILCDHNDLVKANLVFCADNNIVSAFKIAVPGINIRCQHSKMVNSTLMDNSDQKALMLLNLRDKVSDFAVFCNKKLLLSNTFDCDSLDETIYYALSISKQLHLEDARMTLALCGDVDRDKFNAVRQYFANVVLYNGRPLSLTTPEMQHIHTYRYALLLS